MEIHPKFKLNGNSYSSYELKEVAYSLIKEGEAFEVFIGDFIIEWLSNSETVTVSTSGSTGKPKQIQLQKKQMVNSALATGSFFNLKAGATALLCLPCNFIAGKMMLVRAMVLGLELDYIEPNSNPLQRVFKEYNFAAMIPLQAQSSIEKLDLIDTLIVGGAPIGNVLKSKLEKAETSIYETYGMTETITHIAVKKIDASYFKTLSGVTIQKDKRDCLVIDAPKISDEKVVTNDLVKLVSNQKFRWLGRFDTIINSGGVKLIPEQIEKKLKQIIQNRFFVAGIPDDKLGEKLVLVIEGEIDSEIVLQRIIGSSNLEKFEIPKKIYTLPNLVETDTGKIQRGESLKLLVN
jgi:O-succinylbenzoic acid--CoA ligase